MEPVPVALREPAPGSAPGRADTLLLVIVAVLPLLPALAPGAEAYMDNASHLVEVKALVEQIFPQEHWFSGWSGRANAGMAVNQMNAPLAWGALAAVVSAGAPLIGSYKAAILLSNVVFVLGAYALGRRLLPARAAWCGAAFAALALNDLYGYAGAAGGMWPHRLANGILLAGLAARGRSAGAIAVWLAAVVLCHTYSGMAAALVGVAVIGVAAWRREWERAVRWSVGAAVGAAIASPFWVPLAFTHLEPEFSAPVRFWNLLDSLAFVLVPFDPIVLNDPRHWRFVGGALGFPGALVVFIAATRAWRRRDALRDRGAWRFGLALLAFVFVVVAVVVPVAGLTSLGPNPYRHLTLARAALALFAGLGVAALPLPALRAGFLALGVLGAGAGARKLLLPFHPERLAILDDLDRVWADLAERRPEGLVYQVNTALRTAGPGKDVGLPFHYSQVGSLVGVRTGLPYAGTWYAISLVESEPFLRSSNDALLGRAQDWGVRFPRELVGLLADYGIGTIVTVDPDLADGLARSPYLRPLFRAGDITSWALLEPETAPIASGRLRISAIEADRGVLRAHVEGSGPFTFRQTWHPWWQARAGDRKVSLAMDRRTGLVVGNVAGLPSTGGELEIRWVDPTRWTAWLTLAGLLAAAVATRLRPRGAPGEAG